MQTEKGDISFDSFFESTLSPILKKSKMQCRLADAWGIGIIVSAIMIFVGGMLLDSGFVSLFFFVFVFISIYQYTQYNDRFEADFKNDFIKAIIDEVSPGTSYQPYASITPSEYVSSSLYRYRYDYFDGTDLVEGVYDTVSFRSGYLHTECDFGRRRQDIFRGLFFNGQISEQYTAGTYLWPRGAEQLAESIIDEAYRLLPMPYVDDVAISDPYFERFFRICSTNVYEASMILDNLSITKIAGLIERLNRPVSISFVAGRCYVAIAFDRDLFGPGDMIPGDKTETKKYVDAVNLIFEIIEVLGLKNFQ